MEFKTVIRISLSTPPPADNHHFSTSMSISGRHFRHIHHDKVYMQPPACLCPEFKHLPSISSHLQQLHGVLTSTRKKVSHTLPPLLCFTLLHLPPSQNKEPVNLSITKHTHTLPTSQTSCMFYNPPPHLLLLISSHPPHLSLQSTCSAAASPKKRSRSSQVQP
jgi:hypothetical protein